MGYNGLKKSWIFPGQASQFVGMGKDLFDNTDVGKKYYNLANDILEIDIKDISFNGPEEKLKITKYAKCNLIKLKITNDIKKYFKLFFIKERIKTENKNIVIVSFEIPELQKL